MPRPVQSIRIAMWSGPRNISTAMMRSWENRPDTIVVDEPFYAFYLKATGKKHPGAGKIIASGETDWRKVCASLTSPFPEGKTIFFQKQMSHHLLPEIDRSWLRKVTNCFLIRNPAEVINSYIKRNDDPETVDLGFVQQAEIYDWVCRNGAETTRGSAIEGGCRPAVLDAGDVLRDPDRMLRLLCEVVGVEFDVAMLSWPPGRRATDGIWGTYWYEEVERSTSFRPYRAKQAIVPARLKEIQDACQEAYERLYQHRLH
jgi:hypothetical protein